MKGYYTQREDASAAFLRVCQNRKVYVAPLGEAGAPGKLRELLKKLDGARGSPAEFQLFVQDAVTLFG
eukprot:14188667-Alexandrium_andersonii.AAC.1